ncbi:hypothetical protein BH09PSE4_BH09PSE4_00070 [soil metagenome]
MPRFLTLKEIDRAGFDIRLWCYECARGTKLDGTIWMHFEDRGLSLKLDDVRHYFPCTKCGGRDALILPAKATGHRPKTPMDWAVAWFFTNRKAGRERSRRGQ